MKNIELQIADITKQNVCAIVNAANSSLLGGGGVDGAIHNAGGSAILKECRTIRDTSYPDGLPTGQAVATTAGNMPSRYVIHTVGPIYSQCGENCAELLSDCYTNSLKCAFKLGCDSVSFPAVSTGIYGYPKDKAAKIAYSAVQKFLDVHSNIKVYFIFSTQESHDIFYNTIKGTSKVDHQ